MQRKPVRHCSVVETSNILMVGLFATAQDARRVLTALERLSFSSNELRRLFDVRSGMQNANA
jgi:hypothetical protein